ncbi:MAG: hypothetical protein GX094_04895 [Clostridiales bacterium]|nr:hypothetical protein [Clostridiales bacterium]
MVFPGLKKWAEQNNWKVGKNRIYGGYNGYYFTAFDGNGYKCFATLLPCLEESQRAEILRNLNQNKKKLRLAEIKLEKGILSAIFRETWRPLKQEEIKKYLDHVTNVFMEQQIMGVDKCSRCGREVNHEMVLLNEIPVSMCKECFESTKGESQQAEQEFARTDKNYIQGLVGALAGGIVASIPWIIFSYFGWFVAILGLVIGKASLKGYKMFGGKLGMGTRWIILGVTAFSIVFSEVVTYVIAIMVYHEIPFSMDIVYFVLTTPDVIREMAPNILMGCFMGLLGVFQLFKDIKQEVDSAVVRVEQG